MSSIHGYNLTLQANVSETASFMQTIEEIGMNYEWHMRQPFGTRNAQTIYLELRMSLDDARTLIEKQANAAGLQGRCKLLPNKI